MSSFKASWIISCLSQCIKRTGKSDENLVLLQQQIDKVEENHQQNCDNMLLLVNRGKNAEKWLKEQQNFLNQKQEKLAGLLEYRKLLETQITKIQTDLTVLQIR